VEFQQRSGEIEHLPILLRANRPGHV